MNDLFFYAKIGWEHIIGWHALDHQLFLAGLTAMYLFSDWKKVLLLVTAFTIGHSLTLALSVLDILRFKDTWVEFLIPLTIVFTACYNIFNKKSTPANVQLNYGIALVFGLIHGMGFANTIQFLLAPDQPLWKGLLGFNLGLECGQLIVVLVFLLLAELGIKLCRVPRREWILFVSASVFSVALKMSLERLPF